MPIRFLISRMELLERWKLMINFQPQRPIRRRREPRTTFQF